MLVKLMLAAGLVLFAGCMLLAVALMSHHRSSIEAKWPHVTGLLKSANLVLTTEMHQHGNLHSRPGTKPEVREVKVWKIDVKYEFKVGDKLYGGGRAARVGTTEELESENAQPSQSLKAIFEKLPSPPTEVQVHYNPEQPTENYLMYNKVPLSQNGLLKWGIGLVVVAMLIVVAAITSRRIGLI